MLMQPFQAILFDLDGTLLPMDLEKFTGAYFQLLTQRLPAYDPKTVCSAVWEGTKAMTANDGSMTNEDRFWSVFSSILGPEIRGEMDNLEDFYRTDFHKAKAVCGENPLARPVVELAHRRAQHVILATNPLFPRCAVESRLQWVGLTAQDFDDITTYEVSSSCKPSRLYYESICRANALDPAHCLMIGNDLLEDGFGAHQAGMQAHIVTDCLITHQLNPADYACSTFAGLMELL